MEALEKALRAPETAYRPRNYWGWLEDITPEEVVWQIDRMHQAGLGGYVMHARGGLTIPYMGRQWIDSVKAMIEAGRKHGMVTIVDDEHGWPSGFGAGEVNGRGEAYQLKYLLCEELPAGEAHPDRFTLGLWRRDDFTPVDEPGRLAADTPLVHVYYKVDPYYVDNMDPQVVQAFIEAAYEGYKREVGEAFGNGVYGIFSDEPQTARHATPWSQTLPAAFAARYGYTLLDKLYCLFYEAGDYEQLRYDLFSLMQEMFTQNYAGQLYDWCGQNHLVFTGHTCIEEDLYGQIRCSIATMPFYENMHVPGIDWLCRTAPSNLAILQLVSVAAQTGKKRVLSEMYGCAGWNVSMEELKWIAQRQAVLGVNDQLQHLGLYSLRGSRKREYPASLFYQQPWFADYGPYNEYFARISKLVAESSCEVDLLLLHPMKSAWIAYNGYDPAPVRALQRPFDALTDTLLAMNLSIHYGDETILARHGRVEDGAFVVGQMRYHTVMLPSMRSIDPATCRLLEDFLQQGGRVLLAGDAPSLLAGRPSEYVTALAGRFEKVAPDRAALEKVLTAPVTVRPFAGENRSVYLTRRHFAGSRCYYIVNNDLQSGCDFALQVDHDRALHLYDAMTGTLCRDPFDIDRVHLDGGQALVLVEGDAARPAPRPAAQTAPPKTLRLNGRYRLAAASDNALLLDSCALSFDGVQYEAPANHLLIQQRLIRDAADRDIWLKFTFQVDALPQTPAYLVLEEPQKQQITLNGQPVEARPVGWVVDKCLLRLPIQLQAGENVLVLKRRFQNPARVYQVKNDPTIHEAESNRVTVETELESVYIFGQFAVVNHAPAADGPRRTTRTGGGFAIAPLPQQVSVERAEQDGFPFLAGSLTLERRFSLDAVPARARLQMARPDAVVTHVSVNGQSLAPFIWAPYAADLTGLLQPGENTLQVTLTGSNRNLLGPHHRMEGESYEVGPNTFYPETLDTYLVRFGIEGGLTLLLD